MMATGGGTIRISRGISALVLALLVIGFMAMGGMMLLGDMFAGSPPPPRSESEVHYAYSKYHMAPDENSDMEYSEGGDDGADGVAYAADGLLEPIDARKLVFTGQMELRVEDAVAAIDSVTAWAETHDGFIEQSTTDTWGRGVSGMLTLRVPSESFEDARDHIRSLAVKVLKDERQRKDVTGQHADYSARLKNLEVAEQELREFLTEIREQGGTADEVMEIHRELTRVRGEIESLQSQLDVLSEQISYSTINASFTPLPTEPEIVVDSWNPQYVFRQATGDLVGRLQTLADAAIYFTVALLPILLILGAVIWVLYKVYRRLRPRDSAQPPQAAADTSREDHGEANDDG